VLRELATIQSEGYRAYAEALERFGKNESSYAELLTKGGDIYVASLIKVSTQALKGSSDMAKSFVDLFGVRSAENVEAKKE
jgi:hypothetical protein